MFVFENFHAITDICFHRRLLPAMWSLPGPVLAMRRSLRSMRAAMQYYVRTVPSMHALRSMLLALLSLPPAESAIHAVPALHAVPAAVAATMRKYYHQIKFKRSHSFTYHNVQNSFDLRRSTDLISINS